MTSSRRTLPAFDRAAPPWLAPVVAAALVLLAAPGVARADAPNEAAAAASPTFEPNAAMDLRALGAWVIRRSARVQGELVEAEAAAAERKQAHVLGNPVLDGAWSTIPVGPTNPEGLSSPLTKIPSYGLGVSYTFPVGKRAPRQRQAAAEEDAARANVSATVRSQTIDLARVLGEMAVATLRVDGLRELVDQQNASIGLLESRVSAGFATPLDLDRLRIERARTEQQVFSNEVDLRRAQAACASIVATRCGGFTNAVEARAYLDAWRRRAETDGASPEKRPDVRALDAQRRAFRAEAELADATALPDPTVRLGYTLDQFQISGNQRHSVNLSVAIPLPVFDGGRVRRAGALDKDARIAAQRRRILEGAAARIESLREVLASQKSRRDVLLTEMMPKARLVVADLERAASTRLIPLSDVIQARRTLVELLVQEAEAQGDAFETSMDLLAETSSEGDPTP